jgi:hypothetical protein
MFWRALMMAGLTGVPVIGKAQTGADSVAIVEAAARWYVSHMPAASHVGVVVRGGAGSTATPTPRQREAAQRGARLLHATLLPFDSSRSVKLCDRHNAGGCGVGALDLVVDISVSTITGNTGEVLVMQRTNEGPSPRLQNAVHGWNLLFVRSGDGWAFNRVLSENGS